MNAHILSSSCTDPVSRVMSNGLVIFTALLVLLTGCSGTADAVRNQTPVASLDWVNPAFSGTISKIENLETKSALISEWQNCANSEEHIVSLEGLNLAINGDPKFPITKDEASELYARSSKVTLFRFLGHYCTIVFFDKKLRSFHVERHQ